MKQTQSVGSTHEELGFCQRPAAAPADDRLARLVQECMEQADYRWQNRALSAWARNEPIPPQESDAAITKICMEQATSAMGVQAENEALKSRVAELGQDRDSLKALAEKDRDFMQESSDKMISALGEAAKRPSPNATATATSTGTAQTKSDPAAPAATVVAVPAPAATVVTVPAAPVRTRAPAAAACRPASEKKVTSDKPQCEKVAAETPHGSLNNPAP